MFVQGGKKCKGQPKKILMEEIKGILAARGLKMVIGKVKQNGERK